MTASLPTPTRLEDEARQGMFFAAGYGLRIGVERGHLTVRDGVGSARRECRLSRADRAVKRIVVFGESGSVTLDALRWMHEVGISFSHIGHDGSVLTTNASGALDDVRVRRGQGVAHLNGVALNVAKYLIGQKLAGQARVASRLHDAEALAWLNEARDVLESTVLVEDVRFVESKGAAAYWSAWQGVPVNFTRREASQVPSHWLSFGPRRSVLSQSPRKAANPANAMLNYLYAILEAEARIAILRVGADPGMGVLHRDSTRRDSFAADLMEAVRPAVDEYLLDLLTSHTFARLDFFETRDGNCRLMPTIARALAETSKRWSKALAPLAEQTAGMFAAGTTMPIAGVSSATASLPLRFRTPLTQANRSWSHAERRRNRASNALGSRCRGCGCDLGSLNRAYCDRCENDGRAAAAKQAREAQARLRKVGDDARSSDAVRAKHRAATVAHSGLIRAWGATHSAESFSVADYRRDIAGRLQDVPIGRVREATGLSVIYCRQIRLGKRVPHPRHWESLRRVADQFGDRVPSQWDARFYLREIAPGLATLAPVEIAAGTGLSIPYCKRLRRGLQLPRRHHWPALARLAGAANGSDA